MSCFGTGHLAVMPLCAKLVHEGENTGLVEPYVKCIIGNLSFQTRPYSGPYSSKNPTWNETLSFRVQGEGFATIVVYDKKAQNENPDSQNYIGEAHLQLHEVYTKGIFSNWYALTKNAQQLVGQIMIQFSYISEKDRVKEKIQMSVNKHMGMNMAGIDGMNKQMMPSVLSPNAPNLQQPNVMLPGNQIIIQGPNNPESMNRQLPLNGVSMLNSQSNQVNIMQNQMQQQNSHLNNMVIGPNPMNSQNMNSQNMNSIPPQNMPQMSHMQRNKVNLPMHHSQYNQNGNVPPPGMGFAPQPSNQNNFNNNTNMPQNAQKNQNMSENNNKNVHQQINPQNNPQLNQQGNMQQMHNQQQRLPNQQQMHNQNHVMYGFYGNTQPPK